MDKKIDDLLPLDEITAQIKRVEDLHEIFTQSKEIFRETMRLTVEATASRIFKDMITEPEYSGLKISPKYSMTFFTRMVPLHLVPLRVGNK